MDVAILGDIIGEILDGIPSLKTTCSRIGLLSKDIDQLEKLLKEIKDEFPREWQYHAPGDDLLSLQKELKPAVNDLTDLVEELSAADLRRESDPDPSLFWRFLYVVMDYSIVFISSPTRNRLRLAHKIKKVIEDLQDVPSKVKGLLPSEEAWKKGRKLDPGFDLEVVGREKEKKEIIDQLILLRTKTSVPAVTIVGVAGIGKTKLARFVCEDEEVKVLFGFPIWVPGIRDTFDVKSIVRFVIESAAARAEADKKFFIILDYDLRVEIRDEDLTALKRNLEEAAGLSVGALLITTRSSSLVARNIGSSSFKPYALQGLDEDESWNLFKATWNIAASSVEPLALQGLNLEDSSIMRDIRTKIVVQCGGVPLAIITMARLLHSRRSQFEEEIKAEKVDELTKEFQQELAYSYYCFTHRHKLCFAYCSLFPKDYVIDPETLIHLWMGEGFLSSPSIPNPEETGRGYFRDFLERSIFQDLKTDEFNVVRSCRMHPLMHDIARFVTDLSDQKENITVDPEGQQVHDGVLRASFDFSLDVSGGIPASLFDEAKKLRTILLVAKTQTRLPQELKMSTSTCEKIFDSFKSLRMLDLHDLGLKKVPNSIGELKNLRYLNLSLNNMEKLPGSITQLSLLQTLKLSQCHLLKELPKNFEDLISLRHLDIEGCLGLTHMPAKIDKLSSLQTLSLFVASKSYPMGGLGELTSLNNLRGNLEIWHLERLKSPASQERYLKGKQHLQHLTLRWNHEDEQAKGTDKDSLACLEPHENLTVLFVVGYNGPTFSDWLSSIQHLVKFSLNDCPQCQFLPPLDQLPFLRVLELRRLDNLDFIAENSDNTSGDNEGSSSSISNKCKPFFPSLKELIISDCPKLRSWWREEKREEDRQSFACISKLNIQSCPKLDCIPRYPHLDEELVLVNSSVRSTWDTARAKTSEASVPFSKLKSMQIARIEQFPQDSWLENFTSLENLHIRECSHLKSLPQGFQSLSSLQHLTIERCPALTSLPESIGNLKSLDRLVISECNDLTSLPKEMENLKSLNTLIILDCAYLLPRCQPKTGDDWPQISHIPHIQVKVTSQDF
ncbi:putative disease resistance protein RGA3 [Gastrolobium bilobum]|uniref:putative disease resistance protein RGA3 n=1 Tax=Gastrolobium bilobum TaxID=150636 RepID=UPI002AAF3333|nr:putative disease resistance protein RGA3 [Gastrolobium bilobum]